MSSLPFKLNDPSLLHFDAFINAEWKASRSGKRFDILDPGSEVKWASCTDCHQEDVDTAVQSSHAAFQTFRKSLPRDRSIMLMNWYNLVRQNREDIATILTYETGKPLYEAQGEVDYASSFLRWFSGEAERVQGTTSLASLPNRRIFTIKQPIGVAVALVPWNFPIAMVLRKAGAALAAGCTFICKPSPETPISCLVMADLAHRAGFPAGVFNVLPTSLENTPDLSKALCEHPLVKKVSFTGSTRIGQLIASLCAPQLKKVTLELGGNCPFVIFDDANLKQTLDALMALKWRHAGQACVTANRIIVQSGIYEEFVQALREATQALKIGHGAEKNIDIGPVTTPQSLPKIEAHISDAVSRGAQVVLGGNRIESCPGYFFEPTILRDMDEQMLASQEESFGPLACLYRFETEDEAVKLANATSMGLASYCFTKNVDRIWRLYENLEAGMIGLNTGNSSAAESPFGGMKSSGYGKESGKDVAINEYMVTKTGTLTLEGQF
ncbi:unnamed protein product [Penicillium olsonii]|uniref:Aldehyde dehydrogenase domain-containing protein n=1 Tax=Penicillium olsonii TaxID=99116 RepID=A0A9W4H9C6_PENOL|nr:unnamed protein product [Penicillium olsonii]CAG8203974.1 unnamed protein product [Penicillium olsonii]